MKKYLLFFGVMTACIMAVIFAGAVFFLDNTKTTKLSTYQELAKTDLIAKGWVPDFLPLDSTDIVEWHNLDTNQVIVKYNYQNNFIQEHKKSDIIACNQSEACKTILGRLDLESRLSGALKVFEVINAEGEAILIVDEKNKTVEYRAH